MSTTEPLRRPRLPDCMMPGGAEPCAGYRQMQTLYEESRSREQGARILLGRAWKDADALRQLVREMEVYVPLDNGLLARARAALSTEGSPR